MGPYEEVRLYMILRIAKNFWRKAPRLVKGLAEEKKQMFDSLSEALKHQIPEQKQDKGKSRRKVLVKMMNLRQGRSQTRGLIYGKLRLLKRICRTIYTVP